MITFDVHNTRVALAITLVITASFGGLLACAPQSPDTSPTLDDSDAPAINTESLVPISFATDHRSIASLTTSPLVPSLVVISDRDNRIGLWSLESRRALWQQVTHGGVPRSQTSMHASVFSPDGRLLAVAGDENSPFLTVLRVDSGRPAGPLPGAISASQRGYDAIAFSSDSRFILAARSGNAREIDVFDLETGWLIDTWKDADPSNHAVGFSVDRDFVYAVSENSLTIWSAFEPDTPLRKITGRIQPDGALATITAAALTDDLRVAAIVIRGEPYTTAQVQIWDLERETLIRTYSADGLIMNVRVSGNSRFVDAFSLNGTWYRFEIAGPRREAQHATPSWHDPNSHAMGGQKPPIDFTGDGAFLLTGLSVSGVVKLWPAPAADH